MIRADFQNFASLISRQCSIFIPAENVRKLDGFETFSVGIEMNHGVKWIKVVFKNLLLLMKV